MRRTYNIIYQHVVNKLCYNSSHTLAERERNIYQFYVSGMALLLFIAKHQILTSCHVLKHVKCESAICFTITNVSSRDWLTSVLEIITLYMYTLNDPQ